MRALGEEDGVFCSASSWATFMEAAASAGMTGSALLVESANSADSAREQRASDDCFILSAAAEAKRSLSNWCSTPRCTDRLSCVCAHSASDANTFDKTFFELAVPLYFCPKHSAHCNELLQRKLRAPFGENCKDAIQNCLLLTDALIVPFAWQLRGRRRRAAHSASVAVNDCRHENLDCSRGVQLRVTFAVALKSEKCTRSFSACSSGGLTAKERAALGKARDCWLGASFTFRGAISAHSRTQARRGPFASEWKLVGEKTPERPPFPRFRRESLARNSRAQERPLAARV